MRIFDDQRLGGGRIFANQVQDAPGPVYADLTVSYAVLEGVSTDLTCAYAVLQSVSADLEIAYQVAQAMAPATTVLMSGPWMGPVGQASSDFQVAANGSIDGTISITPSDGGAGGTFTPATVAISADNPVATFTYTAASPGSKTISAANNGGLSNPPTITYVAAAIQPGGAFNMWRRRGRR